MDVVSDQWLKSLDTWAKSWHSSWSNFQSCRELGCVETLWRQDPALVHLVSQRSIFRASACGKVLVVLSVVSVQGQLRSRRSQEQQEKVALLLLDLDGMQCAFVCLALCWSELAQVYWLWTVSYPCHVLTVHIQLPDNGRWTKSNVNLKQKLNAARGRLFA